LKKDLNPSGELKHLGSGVIVEFGTVFKE